jgi:hypothetical protein
MGSFKPVIIETDVVHDGKGVDKEYMIARVKIDFHFIGLLDEYKNSDGSINEQKFKDDFLTGFNKYEHGFPVNERNMD